MVAKFSKILGDRNVSIAAVLQHEVNAGQFVPVVIVTHEARAGDVRQAADQIAALDEIADHPVCIRIVDLPEG